MSAKPKFNCKGLTDTEKDSNANMNTLTKSNTYLKTNSNKSTNKSTNTAMPQNAKSTLKVH